MKKTLLLLLAFMATMTAFAEEEWKVGTFTPVSKAAELSGLKTVVASNGDVYASSTYNQVFSFAGANITDPDGYTSACIVKYDKDANEKWAVALVGGSAKVTAMTVDADGTLYATGTFEDTQLLCYGANNADGVIVSGDELGMARSAFVVKITTEGAVSAARGLTPSAPEFPDGYEDYYMIDYGVVPNKIAVEGDKVYVSATYQGDVTELGWKGSYLDYAIIDMFTYGGNRSDGIFSVSKSDLSASASVLTVQHTGRIITPYMDTQSRCDAFSFVTYNGHVYATFIGSGNLTMTTPTDSKAHEFTVTDYENEIKEHGMVIVDPADVANPIIYHAASTGSYFDPDMISLKGEVQNGIVYLAGTFLANFPLDKTVTKENFTSFAAALNLSDLSTPAWTWVNDKETEESSCIGLVVTGAEITVATKANLYQLGIDGEYKKALGMVVADGTQADDKYVTVIFGDNTGKVTVMFQELKPSGIEAIKAAAAKGETTIYNLNGQRVSTPQKGLYIVNGRAAVVK